MRDNSVFSAEVVFVLLILFVERGLAWVWPQYRKDSGPWEEMQEFARQGRVGIWMDDEPVEPWAWRMRRQ